MKRLSCLFLVCLLCVLPVFASSSNSNDIDNEEGQPVVVEVPLFQYSEVYEAFSQALEEARQNQITEYSDITDVSIMPLYNLDSGVTTSSGGLKSILNSLIGTYSPVVVQYQYTSGANTQYLREIMPDYAWMCSCALFALMVFCTFRLGGVLLRKL